MNYDRPEQKMSSKPNIKEIAGKKVLHEGVEKIEQGQEIYIGPLCGCQGFVVPLTGDNGAIIGHIPPATERNKAYFNDLMNLIDTNIDQIKKAYFFYQSPEDTNQKQQALVQRLADIIGQTLEKLGIKIVYKFQYLKDNFFVIVDTGNKTIKAVPLHASELTKSKNTTPLEIEYT